MVLYRIYREEYAQRYPRAYQSFLSHKTSGARSRLEVSMRRGLSPLVGREEEVYTLLRTWKRAKDEIGQLLLLNGEAGIGKSRLTESLKAQV